MQGSFLTHPILSPPEEQRFSWLVSSEEGIAPNLILSCICLSVHLPTESNLCASWRCRALPGLGLIGKSCVGNTLCGQASQSTQYWTYSTFFV